MLTEQERCFLVVFGVLAWASLAEAKPCPSTAVFLYSSVHGEDVCVCAPGLECEGSACVRGSDKNANSFRASAHGFPWRCKDCRCVGDTEDKATEPQEMTLRNGETVVDYPDNHFDAMCRVADTPMHPPQALHNISWIHFPKCGTSFVTVLYSGVCQTTEHSKVLINPSKKEIKEYGDTTCKFCYEPEKHGRNAFPPARWNHGLLHPKRDRLVTHMCVAQLHGHTLSHSPVTSQLLRRNVRLAGTFRNPLSRLRSAYNHKRHAFGMPHQPLMAEQTRHWTLKKWVQLPGISSCQTKMLLGKYCAHNVTVTRADLERAKKIVDDHYEFVGLVEAWNSSVCLFHRMYGGRVHFTETINTRPAKPDVYGRHFRMAEPEELQDLTVDDDPLDYELYQHVRKKFVRLLEEYGLEVPEHIRSPPDIYH